MWDMWLLNGENYKRTVDNRLRGIEPSLAERMKQMLVGDSMYTNGYYRYQIIRKS